MRTTQIGSVGLLHLIGIGIGSGHTGNVGAEADAESAAT